MARRELIPTTTSNSRVEHFKNVLAVILFSKFCKACRDSVEDREGESEREREREI